MEFDPDNVKLLCVGCHLYWWHKGGPEVHEWYEWTIPKGRRDALKMRSMTNDKSPIDYKLMQLVIEQEIKKYKHVYS